MFAIGLFSCLAVGPADISAVASAPQSAVGYCLDLRYGSRADAKGEGADYPDQKSFKGPGGKAVNVHGSGQTYDLVMPARPIPGAPVVVFLHGGAWCQRWDKGSFTAGLPRVFAERGLVAVSANYQLQNDLTENPLASRREHATFADMLRDVDLLIAHLADELPRRGISASSVVLVGASAGGHLAALYATDEGNPAALGLGLAHRLPVSLAVSMAGPVDLTDPLFVDVLLGNTPGGLVYAKLFSWLTEGYEFSLVHRDRATIVAALAKWSPVTQVTARTPPCAFLYTRFPAGAENDGLVPLAAMEKMRSRLAAAGVRAWARVDDGIGHCQSNPAGEQWLVDLVFKEFARTVVKPKATDEALVNPGMGFVFYQNSNRLWAYGSQQEPGDTLDWFPGASVIYFRLNWSTLEPEEGVYRWDVIDSYAQPWIAKGRQIAIRVMCCENRFRYSTPEWVRKAGAKGVDYVCRPFDGSWPASDEKLWEPDYLDPVFLEKLENFAKAFARRYDGDPAVAFVDIGSFGMWGEGHTFFSSRLSYEATLKAAKAHMDLWRRALPRTYLVISDDVAMDNACKTDAPAMKYAMKLGIGFRDDSIMVGSAEKGEHWYHDGWAREFAERTPVVVETEHYDLSKRRGCWTEDLFVRSAVDYRASYMSIHGWPERFLRENRRAIERINRLLGYRLELREVDYPVVAKIGSPVRIVSQWSNVGVAPCHRGATLCWTLLNDEGTVVWTSVDEGSNARSLPPRADGADRPVRFESTCHFGIADAIPVINDGVLVCARKEMPGRFDDLKVPTLRPGAYTLAVSFGTPQGTPELALPLEGGCQRRYPVGRIEVRP